MSIKSIRLKNFKGFKDASINLKPLTVILGPNSAGKSSFGQALVALSKSNARDKLLNLAFDQRSSVEFGGYADFVHADCEGEPIIIELGLKSGLLELGFGGEATKNPIANIKELEITYINVSENIETKSTSEENLSSEASQIISTTITDLDLNTPRITTILTRDNDRVWTISNKNGTVEKYKLFFDGINIEGVSHLTGTAVAPREVLQIVPFQDLASLLEKISYLRPDRVAPRRQDRDAPPSSGPEIDDWGDGVAWYIYEYGDTHVVDTFSFPSPASDTNEAKKILCDLAKRGREPKKLHKAVSDWLHQLCLAISFETKLIDGGRAIQALATLPGQTTARPLTDVGFGVSQVLPILVKGLSVKENGLFIVEQPEAQLHPKPQAELADFFCSMIKCGRNVLVETHSEAFFHRLRILAAMDTDLINNIAVYFIDEPQKDDDGFCRCSSPRLISLAAGAEFDWPAGFLSDGVETEMQVRATRLARKNGMVEH